MEEEKINFFYKFLPSMSTKEISGHIKKNRRLKEIEQKKKKLINEYQSTRRKMNMVGYRELQKENLAIENIRKRDFNKKIYWKRSRRKRKNKSREKGPNKKLKNGNKQKILKRKTQKNQQKKWK
jgi:hypothetical protein